MSEDLSTTFVVNEGDQTAIRQALLKIRKSVSGLGTMASQNSDAVDITGGTISGTDITVGAGKTLDVSAGTLTLADNQIDADKIGTTETDTTLALKPDGAGGVIWGGVSIAHGDTTGKQGGTTGEYYHLTSAQHTIATQAASATVAGYVTTGAQTFAGAKTFSDAPVISSITNTGTLTLPTSTDTIVGRATSDTLTSKTIDADNNTITNIGASEIKADIITGLTEKSSPVSGDFIFGYDTTGGALAKIDIGNLPGGSGGAIGSNLLINSDFRINQRGYASGAATSTANQFTFDRWFIPTSGQNLTFSSNKNGNIVTAPASGIVQVVEGVNIEGGTYTLSWTGTATATVNGTSVSKGGTLTLTAGSNCVVKFSSGTVYGAKLELGSTATSFISDLYDSEFKKCQRYYQKLGFVGSSIAHYGYQVSGNGIYITLTFPSMRAAPTGAISGTWTYGNCTAPGVYATSISSLTINCAASSSGPVYFQCGSTSGITLSSEITS